MKYLVLAFFLIFSGCAGLKTQYFNSSISSELAKENEVLADDIVSFIEPRFLPNSTTFYIKTSDKTRTFYNLLTQKLRQKGYAISDRSDIKDVTFFSYTILKLDNNVLATYNINENRINRIYEIIDGKLTPTGTITNFN